MQDIVYYILVGLALVVSIISAVIQFFKNRRNKISVSADGKVTTNNSKTFSEILGDKIMEYTALAEKAYEKYKGTMSKTDFSNMKLKDVLNSLKLDCVISGATYDEEKLKAEIEKYIAYTKKVNV